MNDLNNLCYWYFISVTKTIYKIVFYLLLFLQGMKRRTNMSFGYNSAISLTWIRSKYLKYNNLAGLELRIICKQQFSSCKNVQKYSSMRKGTKLLPSWELVLIFENCSTSIVITLCSFVFLFHLCTCVCSVRLDMKC
jgi:hypothetical protein